MEGLVVNYRRGRRTMHGNQVILEVPGVGNKEKAASLLGKKVVAKVSDSKTVVGVVSGLHGNSGRVRVIFSKGVPGQIVGKRVEIIE